MKFRSTNTLLILLCFSSVLLHSQSIDDEISRLFGSCEKEHANMIRVENDTFKIRYPEYWKVDNKIAQGLDLSSTQFNDSNLRTVLLTILPYSQFKAFARKNPMISYFQYLESNYKGLPSIFSIRNDLKKGSDDSVFWRAELKLIDEKNNLLYILVFSKPAHIREEPEWCEFKPIVESLHPKMK